MTDHDKAELKKIAKGMLEWKFPQHVNTKEAGEVLHDVSTLLIKISNHINKKIEDATIRKNNQNTATTEGAG